ncbi:MAG: hypothetical protein WAN30_05290 [Acidimicrobiales bacterium]
MRSNPTYRIVGAALVLWLVVSPFTWRDLRRRPRESVRGPKWLWFLASANVSGSLAYWLVGRRDRLETEN